VKRGDLLRHLRKHGCHLKREGRARVALVRLPSGRIRRAELHWYEAHGIGRKEVKRKRYLD